ncbi:hypothetical protein WCLP8_1500008 [uncultured Gammaproteobacteria bacterium]
MILTGHDFEECLETEMFVNHSDLELFEKIVAYCADTKKNSNISNKNIHHALILAKAVFSGADTRVHILSGGLNFDKHEDVSLSETWVNFTDAARRFLSKDGSELDILIADTIKDGESNRFLTAIINDACRKGQVIVRVPTDKRIENVQHFMVSDQSAYRIETDDKGTIAIGNFGDNTTARKLIKIHERISKKLFEDGACHIYRFSRGENFSLQNVQA